LLALALCGRAIADPHEDARAADKRGDYAAELTILQPNADKGLAWAQNNLGNLYDAGNGVPQDYAKAVGWYRRAADQGDVGGELNLGQMYLEGHGVPQDYARAMSLIRKAADQGNSEAEVQLGRMFSQGLGVARDDAQAESWYRKAVAQGNVRAVFLLSASALPSPNADDADISVKAARYRKAGDAGDDMSRSLLKLLCIRPQKGRPPGDCDQVFVWTHDAAEKGDVRAQTELAGLYDRGAVPGGKPDPEQGTLWIRKAAEQGDAGAQSQLALRYELGMGAPKDQNQALAWYRKAAEQGDLMGEINMAGAYEKGDGVPRDDAQAFYWNRKLADTPLADAQRKVGVAYATGKGVAQDYVQAYKWLDIAIRSRPDAEDHDAQMVALDGVAAHLTPAQLAEAKHLAETWTSDIDKSVANIRDAKTSQH
jgi:TPR repeat protein